MKYNNPAWLPGFVFYIAADTRGKNRNQPDRRNIHGDNR